ncbi:MAG: hypothetical protein HFG96_08330 [Lachnospiraceae bacterium]|jgi:vacuolar-type H+-ATPase subunit E/Vma4|nr:hypothetical protein [Lachnospiraceae bacterium]RKJ50103.1 hypothetical protein D7Y05_06850 [bacterium 1XD42-54]
MKKIVKDAEIAAKETAEKVVAEVKEAPKTARKVTRKAVKAATETVAGAAEIMEKKAEEVKTEAKKAVAAKKAAPAKKAAVKETVYLQYLGKEINQNDLMKRVKEIWTKDMKQKTGDLKSVTLYVKPEENMVYYVLNNDVTGSIGI